MNSDIKDESGLGLQFGTYEDAKKWIGRSTAPTTGEVPVNGPMIRLYCSAVQDANPSYWDDEFAKTHWGGLTAPHGMLQTWTIPMQWRPDGARTLAAICTKVPLPGDKAINVTTDFEFIEPAREGDLITVTDSLKALSEEKTTKVGVGYFVTSVNEYRNQHGTLLARSTNVLFRYLSEPQS